MEYKFFKNSSPNLDLISSLIEMSYMENKNILYSRWDENDKYLKIYWNGTLSESDKILLDNLIRGI